MFPTIASLFLALAPSSQGGNCPPVSVIGSGCDYGVGGAPLISFQGSHASLPAASALVISNVHGSGVVHLVLGSSPIPLEFFGCTIWVHPDVVSAPLIPGLDHDVVLPIPTLLVLLSGDVYVQAAVLDMQAPAGFAASEALRIQFGDSCVGIDVLTAAFSSADADSVDAARNQLMDRGYEGIEALLGLAASTDPSAEYGGTPLFHWSSSTPAYTRNGKRIDTLQLSALYTIDAIVYGIDRPYRFPAVYRTQGDPNVHPSELITLYANWLNAFGIVGDLSSLQQAPHPFSGTHVRWISPLLQPSFEGQSFGVASEQEGPVLVGPPTPVSGETMMPADPTVDPGPGETVFVYKDFGVNSGSYNCLGHAIAKDDRWIHPWRAGDAVGGEQVFEQEVSLELIMAENGFLRDPPGSGDYREVMCFLQSPPHSEQQNMDGFQHAISRNVVEVGPPGPWFSKNGVGPLYQFFGDPVEQVEDWGYFQDGDIVESYYKPI